MLLINTFAFELFFERYDAPLCITVSVIIKTTIVENIRDLTDFLILAREELAEEGDETTDNPLDDRHLVMTIADIFLGL